MKPKRALISLIQSIKELLTANLAKADASKNKIGYGKVKK